MAEANDPTATPELEWKAPPRGRKPDIIDVPATVAILKANPGKSARVAKGISSADANRLVRQIKEYASSIERSTTHAEGAGADEDKRDVYACYTVAPGDRA